MALAVASSDTMPAHDGWLTSGELMWLSSRRAPKRRTDWRLGRWAAKQAVLRAVGARDIDLAVVEILAKAGGAPTATLRVRGEWPALSLSLSHSEGFGFAVATPSDVRIGCDVESVVPHTDAFIDDYFTDTETLWIRERPDDRDLRATLAWSLKESVLKALGEGLRLDTRFVCLRDPVPPADDGSWRTVGIETVEGDPFVGWWRRTPGFVWTLAWNAAAEELATGESPTG